MKRKYFRKALILLLAFSMVQIAFVASPPVAQAASVATQVPFSWEFDTSLEGWTAADPSKPTNYVYFSDLAWQADDPAGAVGGHGLPDTIYKEVAMWGPTIKLNPDGGKGRYAKVRMRQTSASIDGGGANFISSAGYQGLPFDNRNQGTNEYKIYTVDMSTGPRWKDEIKRIYISVGLGALEGEEFYVDYVRLQNTTDDYSRVVFEKTEHGSAATNATGNNNNNYYALANDIVTVIAKPDPGYFFTGWTSDDSVVFADASALETTFTMPAGDVKITPNFAKDDNNDISTMTDETFFGAWNGTTWSTVGKFDYSVAGLGAVEAAVKNGNYSLAKTKLLSYYRNRTPKHLPALNEPGRADLLRAELEADDIYFLGFNETPMDVVTFTTTPSTVTATVTEGVNTTLQLATELGFMLMGRDRSDNAATLSSREDANTPVLVVKLADDSERRFYPIKDTWVNAGSGATQNHGSDAALKVREYGNANNTTKRSYIVFDLKDLGEKSVKSAALELYGSSDSDNYKVVVVSTGNLGFDENTVSWSSIEGETYSWQGKEGGTDWNAPAYSHKETAYFMARFPFMPDLAAAYAKTGDEYYASNAFRVWLDFIVDKGNSDPMYTRSLDTAIRLDSQVNSYHVLKDSPSLDPGAHSAMLKNLWQAAQKLSNSDNFHSSNNWGVIESKGLFEFSLYFPEFTAVSKSGGWMQLSQDRLSSLISNLVNTDGSYGEASSTYSGVVLKHYITIKHLGSINNISFSTTFDTKLNQLATYAMDFTRPDGGQAGFGDGDVDTSFNDLLETMAALYPERTDLLYHLTNGAQGTPPDHTTSFYPVGKSTFLKTGYGADDMFMSIDLNSGGHSHPDLNSITAYAYGKSLLTDVGVYFYGDNPITAWVQQTTEAHNTIEVDGTAQAKTPTVADISGFATNSVFDYYEGTHNAYKNTPHTRNVLFLRGKFWIVSDSLANKNGAQHSYKQTWHYTPNANVTIDPATGTAKSAYATGANMQIIPADPSGLTNASVKTGYFSPYGGFYTYADYVAYEINNTAALTTFDTVLYPTREGDNPNVTVSRLPAGASLPKSDATALQINLDDGNGGNIGYYYLNHKTPDGAVTFGAYSFDGKTAYIETDPSGSYVQATVKDGKSLERGGTSIISSATPISDMGIDWNGSALAISGSLLAHSADASKAIAIYAPGAASVTLNGKPVTFTRDGDYVYAAAANTIKSEEVVISWEFDTDLEGWTAANKAGSYVYLSDLAWQANDPVGAVGGHGLPSDDSWTEVAMWGPKISLSTADGNARYAKVRMRHNSASTLGGAVNYVPGYKSVRFDNSSPGTTDYKIYTVDMKDGPQWGGDIERIYISLGMGTLPDEEFYVDYIRFQNTDKDYGRLKFNAAAHGTIAAFAASGSSARYAAAGDTVAVKATPDTGYVLAGWTSDNPSVAFADPTASITNFTMPADDVVEINATFRPVSSDKDITSFVINGKSGEINGQHITVILPFGTDVTELAPTVVGSAGATISPASGIVQNFTDPVTYTVTAEDGSFNTYTVTVIAADPTAQDIADAITAVTTPAKDATQLTMPGVPSGFAIAIAAATPPGIIALDGTIVPPAVATVVALTFTVTDDNDPNDVGTTAVINVTVPAKTESNGGDNGNNGDNGDNGDNGNNGNNDNNDNNGDNGNNGNNDNNGDNGNAAGSPVVEKGNLQVTKETTAAGGVVNKVVVSSDAFTKALAAAGQSPSTGGQGAKVTIDATGISGSIQLTLPGKALAEAAGKAGDTIIRSETDMAVYELPISILALDAFAARNGVSADEVSVQVKIEPVDDDLLALLKQKAGEIDATLASDEGVKFSIVLVAQGREEELEDFGTVYTSRILYLDNAVNPNETAAVMYDPVSGEFIPVPSRIVTIGGRQAIELKRPGNSVYTVLIFSKNFADLKGHWAEADISLMASKLIVKGVSDTRFNPEKNITRAEFATLLVRALGLTPDTAAAAKFADVSRDAWYAGFVGTAAQYGIVYGVNGDNFAPGREITRAEMAVMVSRALAMVQGADAAKADTSVLEKFKDTASLRAWETTPIAELVGLGVLNGVTSDTLAPAKSATRAQAAVILLRAMRVLEFI